MGGHASLLGNVGTPSSLVKLSVHLCFAKSCLSFKTQFSLIFKTHPPGHIDQGRSASPGLLDCVVCTVLVVVTFDLEL